MAAKRIINLVSLPLVFLTAVTSYTQLPGTQTAKIKSNYNSSSNETTVLVHPYLLVLESNDHNPSEMITLTFSFAYSGQRLTTSPSMVRLSIASQARFGWEFELPRERTLQIKVDGEDLSPGPLQRVEAKRAPMYSLVGDQTRFYYVEKLIALIPSDNFRRMAGGKKVTIRVGKGEHSVNDEGRKLLREIAGRMTTG